MFHNIAPEILRRMKVLEKRDAKEQENLVNIDSFDKLRQVPPETGRFLSIMALTAPEGNWLEIGTSAGYSALWISLACKVRGTTLTTFEINPNKIKKATETFDKTNTSRFVNIVEGNVLDNLLEYKNISFCFLDAEKKIYKDCYEIMLPNMVPGAILLADNVISHRRYLKSMVNKTLRDERVDAVIIPIGKGILLARKKDV